MLDGLDYLLLGAALIGGILMILWVYNSTGKERRQMLRANREVNQKTIRNILERGEFWQKIIFALAFAVTGVIILVFALVYYVRFEVAVNALYFYAATAFILLGIATIIYTIISFRR
ncbi:MAG: hypothetical protein GY771_13365 [bacterium]|nr:hypothetical protein [bacterium]